MKLKLDGWQKVRVHPNHTVLRNQAGHELKISHGALSAKNKADLHALPMAESSKAAAAPVKMAEGGIAASNANQSATMKEDTKQSKDTDLVNSIQDPEMQRMMIHETKRFAKGGQVQRFEGGGDVIPPSNFQMAKGYDDNPQTDTGPNWLEQQFIPGGALPKEAGTPDAPPVPPQQTPQMPIGTPTDVNGTAIGTPPAANGTPTAPAPDATASTDPTGAGAYATNYLHGIDVQKKGLADYASAEAVKGAAEAKALEQSQIIQQKTASDFQNHFSQLEQERQNFLHDIQNNHIDPSRYMASQDTGQRVSTAIGLILGGIGGGITHQENPALKFLSTQIDNDVQAQKAELGKKENLLSANLRQFGNLKEASEMTRAMQLDVVSNQLKQAGAKAAGPLAAAAALQAAGKLDTEAAAITRQVALSKTMASGGLAGGSPDNGTMGQTIQAMRIMNPEMAKSLEARYVPSVGMATVPVPAEVRSTIIAKDQLNQMAVGLYKWAAKNSGSLDPSVINEGKTRAAELQSAYRNSINGGVFKKGEQEFIDNIVDSDPTKFFNSIRVLPKLQQVIQSNNAQLNTLKRGYGLPAMDFTLGDPVINKK